MRKFKSREEVAEIFQHQQASGLSVKKYCDENGISFSTFQSWKVRERKEKQPQDFPFVKVHAHSSLSQPFESINYQIEVGDATLLVPRGFNITEVKAIVELLSC